MARIDGREVSEKEFYQYVEQTMTGGLVTEYPKMLYRAGGIVHNTHHHQGAPLLIGGKHEAETLIVANEDEELAAIEAGWSTKLVDPEPKRGPGRPARQEA